MPLLHHQPFKGIFILLFASRLLLWTLPVGFLLSIPRSCRPRASWPISRCLWVIVLRSFLGIMVPIGGLNIRDLTMEVPDSELVDAKFAWVEPLESDMIVGDVKKSAERADVKPTRIPGYWYFKKGAKDLDISPAREGEKVIYHLHGGGFWVGTAHPSDGSSILSRSLLECTSLRRTFALDYRLSTSHPLPPTNPYPAALLDVLAGYHYLVSTAQFRPENIIVLGDSAGGTLAVAMVRYLVENKIPSLPPPGGLVTMSIVNVSGPRTGPESSAVKNRVSDYLDTRPNGRVVEHGMKSFQGQLDLEEVKTNPYLSPSSPYNSPSFANFPKTYIVAGGAEILLDDSTFLAERMKADAKDGKWVTLDTPQDAVHDFCVLEWHEPERSQVLQRLSKWIDDL